MRMTLVVKAKQCVGCKRCEIECAVAHSKSQNLSEAVKENTPPRARVQVTVLKGHAAPVVCRNCKKAACIEACPSGALYRDDESRLVLLNEELCTACGVCIEACPFNAIRMDEERQVIIKCDYCMHRLQRGEQPACVEACLTGALELRETPNS